MSVSGTDPDTAIGPLAGLYAGKAWYSTASEGDYWFHYADFGYETMSLPRSQMSGYLRGDVAVEGEFVVQWIDAGEAHADVGRDEVRLAAGVPTLFPIERRFEMEDHDWDQRLVHMDRGLVMNVPGDKRRPIHPTRGHSRASSPRTGRESPYRRKPIGA